MYYQEENLPDLGVVGVDLPLCLEGRKFYILCKNRIIWCCDLIGGTNTYIIAEAELEGS